MYADDTGGETPLEDFSDFPVERSGVFSPLNKMHLPISRRRMVLPVVHIRTRPILPYLGEGKNQRHVWCLDHQKIVVRSNKLVPSRCRTASPLRSNGTPRSAPTSPFVSSPPRQYSLSSGWLSESLPPKMLFARKTPRKHHSENSRSRGTTASATKIGRKTFASATPEVTPLNNSGVIRREEHFNFDFVHGEDATQEELFEESVLDFVDMALLAQSVAIVCYGPTGSGKTYSMMGSTPGQALKKIGKVVPAVDGLLLLENRPIFDSKNRGKVVPLAERLSNSQRSNLTSTGTALSDTAALVSTTASTAIPVRETFTPAVKIEEEQQQPHRQQQQQRNFISPRRGADANDMEGSSLSSGLSQFDLGFSTYMDAFGGTRNEMSLTGISSGLTESMTVPDEGNETMGLLPRIVLILLERLGERVELGQNEPSVKAAPGNRSGNGKDKSQETQKQRHNVSLTLKELTLYGVELYMDEFYDLLDPAKRAIPNISDIGGLDAFCQRLNIPNSLAVSSSCGGKRASGGGTGSTSFRGGGVRVSSVEDFRRCYKLATRNRVMKGHQRNDRSSRSHAVFILQLQFDLADSQNAGSNAVTQSIYSYVAMVDLAGSERVKETKVEGVALREAQYINKSLSAFSAVLLALYQRSSHIPYRDSKLTRLLRPCLELGRVLVLVHVAPCSAEETISSLKFAEQARYTNVQSHSLLNAATEVVALFDDMTDPHAEELMEAYHRTEVEYTQLCAEVRLAHLSRETPDGSLTSAESPGENSSTLQELAQIKKRDYVIRTLVKRHMHRYKALEEKRLQESAAEIEREWAFYVENVKRSRKQDMENLKLSIEKLRSANARLAEENSKPVLRDDHVMAIQQRLKELSTEINNYAREKLLLMEGMRAIRQRLALQTDLERCLDQQLQEFQQVAAGGGDNGARLPVDSIVDEELGEIYHQQLLLSREMSLLRRESTCFVRGDRIWEGIWARVMRQELLLAVSIDMEMMEGILLRPQSLRWVLEANGMTPDAARDVVFPTSSVARNVKILLDTLETLKKQSASNPYGSGESDVRDPPLPHIPLLMSNGDEVRPVPTLIGRYGDEAKLQEAAVRKLVEEGIFCEATFFSMGVEELVRRRLPATGLMQQTNYKVHWGCLRLVHPPKDTSSYSLELFQRTYSGSDKVRDRRVISIPLGEPQLRIKLHVIEAEGIVHTSPWDDGPVATEAALPLIALELQGVHPVTNTGTQQYQEGEKDAKLRGHTHYIAPCATDTGGAHNGNGFLANGAESSSAREFLLSKRLDCGGELLLPSGCMAACEEGSGVFLFHFPERIVARKTRTEAVECIVAALSGLTLPFFPSASRCSSSSSMNADTSIGDISVVTYQHVPYLLLSSNGGPLRGGDAKGLPVLRRVGAQSLGYCSATQIFFYFQKEDSRRMSADGDALSRFPRSPLGPVAMPLSIACAMLGRLGALTPFSGSGVGSSSSNGHAHIGSNNAGAAQSVDETESMMWRMQQLYAFRRKTRARVRQQIFDAEDIKAELLYSYSDSEFMRGSYIKDVLKEARELIDLQQPQTSAALALRGMIRATPGVCRELCGAVVPWTLWHWAHRWKALQLTHSYQQALAEAYDMEDDEDSMDGSEGGGRFPMMASSGTPRDDGGQAFIVFEELPCFLACME
ncbi:kinesin, putative [Trypanosoma cruzi]|nr:kinesin, putative [Trypanosoma cruzi]